MTQGEIDYSVFTAQSETVEDLMRRRLQLEYSRGSGLSSVSAITRRLQEIIKTTELTNQVESYRRIMRRFSDLKNEIEGGTVELGIAL